MNASQNLAIKTARAWKRFFSSLSRENRQLAQKLDFLLVDAEERVSSRSLHGYLPSLLDSLEKMQEDFSKRGLAETELFEAVAEAADHVKTEWLRQNL